MWLKKSRIWMGLALVIFITFIYLNGPLYLLTALSSFAAFMTGYLKTIVWMICASLPEM